MIGLSVLAGALGFMKAHPKAMIVAITAAACFGTFKFVETRIEDAYVDGFRNGRADVINKAQVDSSGTKRTRAEHDTAKARVDTVWRTVTKRIAEVESVFVQVPDSIRQKYPIVDAALKKCTALANDCEAAKVASDAERKTASARISDAENRASGLSILHVADRDTIDTERERFRGRIEHIQRWQMAERTVCAASVGKNLYDFVQWRRGK